MSERVDEIVLVKKDGTLGRAPVGTEYRATFRNPRSLDDARVRAFRMLQRDRPSENPMCWGVASYLAAQAA